ncbi:VPS9 domain-containing protein [Verticillium alfalfae VaMs.102]|uniref:VPS9 domain-containing protein n=1 Tax=Verticillium alfalfae (strain VaMs.102 / ATCC MYA-4576 / FGSC 10136) TaxID=526221 RepID=C9SMY9_VERA1|nr:VPS9 domain-containing protein [Verticillium alfalfae VaMs.102]EEY20154.1 VPS9 domain-containing protein [Verticillium alfalfae VaMs.102]
MSRNDAQDLMPVATSACIEWLALMVCEFPSQIFRALLHSPQPPPPLQQNPPSRPVPNSNCAKDPSSSTAPIQHPQGGKEAAQNLREMRGKAKQYTTINGRTVVIKDTHVYSNKGFKSLAQAQLLNDAIWYPDVLEPRPWLIYYITKPLVGIWEEVTIAPAILVDGATKRAMALNRAANVAANDGAMLPRKKDIKSFHELLNQFPIIARQMQPGLEKLFLEFTMVFERPLPPPPSASSIPDPLPDGPIASAMKKARSSSMSTPRNGMIGPKSVPVTEPFYAEDDEDVMRASFETAVTTAIDLFQAVDKQQLSMLGATTDLTGPIVERLIERYVTENVHHLIFPRLSAMKRPYDLELEAKIRQMEFIDLSQLGIGIDGGPRVKHDLTIHLGLAVEEFKKMGNAMSPQEMLELLLSTTKMVTQLTAVGEDSQSQNPSSEKPTTLTVNADTLVSLLLFVVIRAQVRNLQARLVYIRHFIYIDDVENGEMGYALSTFEAVLAYLAMDSGGLRRASRRNKALWDATRNGKMDDLQNIMEPEPGRNMQDEDEEDEHAFCESPIPSRPSSSWSVTNGSTHGTSSRRPSTAASSTARFSSGSGLSHVFPFEAGSDASSSCVDFVMPPLARIKKVAMDTRSMSSSSEISYHSRAASIGTLGSALEGDVTVERLSQTHDLFGESVLMMAVQHERPDVLQYLLSLNEYYTSQIVLDDINNEDTTLLSAAIQLGHTELIDTILDFVAKAATTTEQLSRYLASQDIWGRSCAHYMFHAPYLIAKIGKLVPWRQKDKNGQTPLFALCRSYDHGNYLEMVPAGLDAATAAQADGQPLHIDDHIDGKGNSLLHIVNDPQLALGIMQQWDVDVNATNDKKFTHSWSLASMAGLTWCAHSCRQAPDARITGVVRAYFVEDATVRLVLKSAAPADHLTYTVTTSRRSLSDFEHLGNLLALENPASWIPSVANARSPFQIPSKPSRAVLRDIQIRTDWFLRIMLAHSTFSTHEMLWEFFLVPDIQLDMMDQRSNLKAETRAEKVREELEPLEDVREVEQFINHARDMIRSVNYSTKSVARRASSVAVVTSDLHDAASLLHRAVSTLPFLPEAHLTALEAYVRVLAPTQLNPPTVFHGSLLALQTTVQALLSALSRPPALISQIATARKTIERNYNSLSRSSRWPLGLLDDTRQRMNEEKEEKARQSQEQLDDLGRELRYTQQVVAGELAGYQETHEKMGRHAIRQFARGMIIQERIRLEGMTRLLRKLREAKGEQVTQPGVSGGASSADVSQASEEPAGAAACDGADAGRPEVVSVPV